MKVKNFRKLICGLLAVLMMFSLVGCGDKMTDENTENLETETLNSVVAVINGKEVTRTDVGESLLSAEKDVISGYIYNQMTLEFFKDVSVTDSEVELQLQMLKAQVGEDSWPMYLAYYGGGTEESFKEILKDSLRQEKYISEKMDTITIEDSALEAEYNTNPNGYNIAVLDVIFFDTYEDLLKAKELYESGKTLEEISEELENDIFPDEHTYFASEGLTWSAKFEDSEIGDYIFSNEDSGSLVIARIEELNVGIDNQKVREDLENNLKYNEAYNVVNTEYEEFLRGQKVQIFGEDFPLVSDTPSSETTIG